MRDNIESHELQEEATRYLIFKVCDEVYGTPLLGVREVVEFHQPKTIPNTTSYFAGVINIRGEIVGVIDLRKRFGYNVEENNGVAMIVFSTAEGTIAAIVDKVEAVIELQSNQIEARPNVKTKVRLDYLLGIGKHKDQLITLVDLNGVLAIEDLVSIKESKLKL
ncbi:MAG: purine-binding chemotaxis protein CheW [Proteobacteria bacterium]|nr:purine-binding chemotaxis protein CheW [Pseudomonadota bacterium]